MVWLVLFGRDSIGIIGPSRVHDLEVMLKWQVGSDFKDPDDPMVKEMMIGRIARGYYKLQTWEM